MCAPVGVAAPPGLLPALLLKTRETPANLDNSANTVNSVISKSTLLPRGTLAAMGKLDPDDSRPPYLQIAGALTGAIESGDLTPGSQLPALNALATEYDVSLGTVKSAIAALRDAGRVVTRPGKGSFVRTSPLTPEPDADAELAELRQAVTSLANRLDAVEERLAER